METEKDRLELSNRSAMISIRLLSGGRRQALSLHLRVALAAKVAAVGSAADR